MAVINSISETNNSTDLSYFVEQAEYLETDLFDAWSTEHPDEDVILRKLMQPGAKLITGPRGCGKTTLMLKAYKKMLLDNTGSAFPVYVNFKSSLKLEPLYKSNADAVYWFNYWLLLKIYQGIEETLSNLHIKTDNVLTWSKSQITKFVVTLELGQIDFNRDSLFQFDIPTLENDLEKILSLTSKSRCVLLLDDAAHAFSAEQQKDFFDFFRKIKSRVISPKAAIYPGVTVYSSTFHVGHDAEEIDVWVKPYGSGYVDFMTQLLERRLPINIFDELSNDTDLIKLIIFASFGMPRSLLNTIRIMYKEHKKTNRKNETLGTRSRALETNKEVFDNTLNVYRSLKFKLPIYSEFIALGESIYIKIIEILKEYNKTKEITKQSVTIAIKRPIPIELSKVLGFLQYSGLIVPRGEVSKGNKGIYELFAVHYAGLIERNALFGKSTINITSYVIAFENRNAHAYTRVTPSSLVGGKNISDIFHLSLPPCQKCHTPRVSENARFCPNCGSQLKTISIFESLVSKSIDVLPLTTSRRTKIKSKSNLRTVKDILMDHENRELRQVPQVGPYWAKQIYAYAEEFIV